MLSVNSTFGDFRFQTLGSLSTGDLSFFKDLFDQIWLYHPGHSKRHIPSLNISNSCSLGRPLDFDNLFSFSIGKS